VVWSLPVLLKEIGAQNPGSIDERTAVTRRKPDERGGQSKKGRAVGVLVVRSCRGGKRSDRTGGTEDTGEENSTSRKGNRGKAH